jgi:integrase
MVVEMWACPIKCMSAGRLMPARTISEAKVCRLFRGRNSRHTFASWYIMNGGDLYELAKILGHANIKMTERYAKLGRQHIARTGSTARELWRLLEAGNEGAVMFPYCSPR